jgi:hypothetical protein
LRIDRAKRGEDGKQAIHQKRPEEGRKTRPTFLFDMQDQPAKECQGENDLCYRDRNHTKKQKKEYEK